MDNRIQEILNDLYALDASFRKHEAKLIHLIGELLAHKPNITIDAQFAQHLRNKLMVRARDLEEAQPHYNSRAVKKLSWFTYAFASLGLVALVASSALYYQSQIRAPQTAKEIISLLSKDTQVKSLEPNSFGSLSQVSFAAAGGRGGDTAQTEASVPNAAPDAVKEPSSLSIDPGRGGGFAPVNFRYTYSGDAFNIPGENLDVYQRNSGSANQDGSIFSQVSLGLLDLGKFRNRILDSLSIAENREFGYQISANFRQGTVSIYENWEQWPMPYKMCDSNPTESCYQNLRLKPEQVPADEEVIATANAFLNEYGIDIRTYGEPVVQNFWREELARSTDPSLMYVPDVVSVVYPVKLNNEIVYDESGNPSGLYVSVNVRFNRVSAVSELSAPSYQTSAYQTEQDSARIIKLAETGNFRGYPVYNDPNAPTETIELGTPRLGYARVWQYSGSTSRELYVPAMIFPVTKAAPSGYYMPKNIVIPIIKEILDNQNNPPVEILERPVAAPAAE